jgi:membrane protein
MSLKYLFNLFKQTFQNWSADKAPRLAAALAYYAVFSLAPLIVIIIGIVGLYLGKNTAQGQIMGQIQGLIGKTGAQAIQSMVTGAQQRPSSGIFATVIGIVLLLLAAGGLFGELQDSLNTIWNVKIKPAKGFGEVLAMIRQRFFSFAMVLGIGFLLLVSLIITAAISAIGKIVFSALPGTEFLMEILNFVISFLVITVLFALIYKVLPDVQIRWRDVWLGAAFTALLFVIGKFLIGFYLGRSSYTSTYGAAGSLVIVLLWIYYSAQILFFGAEFTQVYAAQSGMEIKPAPNAEWMTAEDRANQGMQPKQKAQAAAPTPIYRTEQAGPSTAQTNDRGALSHLAKQPGIRQVQAQPRPETPASKALAAFGMVSLALVGYLASLFVVSKRH